MTRIPYKSGFEQDVFSSRARQSYCYTQRAGVCKKAKKQYNKRLRKAVRFGADE